MAISWYDPPVCTAETADPLPELFLVFLYKFFHPGKGRAIIWLHFGAIGRSAQEGRISCTHGFLLEAKQKIGQFGIGSSFFKKHIAVGKQRPVFLHLLCTLDRKSVV